MILFILLGLFSFIAGSVAGIMLSCGIKNFEAVFILIFYIAAVVMVFYLIVR